MALRLGGRRVYGALPRALPGDKCGYMVPLNRDPVDVEHNIHHGKLCKVLLDVRLKHFKDFKGEQEFMNGRGVLIDVRSFQCIQGLDETLKPGMIFRIAGLFFGASGSDKTQDPDE